MSTGVRFAVLSIALQGGVFAVGCRSPTVSRVDVALAIQLEVDAGPAPGLDFLLDAGVDFGAVPVLEPADQTLLLSELSGAGLIVNSVGFSPAGGPFSLVGAAPANVGAGSATPLTLRFVPPRHQLFTGAVTLSSNDGTRPLLSIPLRGSGSTEAKIQVTPSPLDFGAVGQGQTQTGQLTIASIGTAPLLISGIALDPASDPAFAFVSSTKTPLTLANTAPANSLPLTLSFSPSATTAPRPMGAVRIQASDPLQPTTTVPLLAATVLAPIPRIVAPATVAVGATIALDGTTSTDPNLPPSLPLSYAWALTYKELGSSAQLSDVAAARPSLTADVPGTYKVQLDVTNDAGVQDTAPAFATISARPQDDLYVELVWDNMPVDLDLHFVGPGGALNGAGDCTADYQDAGFGCQHSSDHLLGPGPEWASIAKPNDGTYTIDALLFAVHDAASPVTLATARVYVYGVLSGQLTHQLTHTGQSWQALSVTWPSGSIATVDQVSP